MGDVLVGEFDLRDITSVGQDGGSLLGLRLVAAQPERFARVVIGNGGMPTGERPPNEAFLSWQTFARTTEHFPVGGIVAGGCAQRPSDAVIAAYDAPFPDDSYMAGARALPSLVPTSPDDPAHDANFAAWDGRRPFGRCSAGH